MVDNDRPSKEEIRDMEKKEFRKQFPSGWMEVSRYETLVVAIDALLETPASREFTVQELADKAGTTKRSLDDRISLLVELGIVTELEEGRENTRYQLNNQNPITHKIYELNNTVNKVKNEELPKSITRRPSDENINDITDNVKASRFTPPADELDDTTSGGGFIPKEGAT